MPLARSTRLGPYEILDLLGAGGMGEVYRAFDPRLGREVAIKVLPPEVACSPERLARFEREARAVAALNHPNILTVFDVGTASADQAESEPSIVGTPPVPYVVSELLDGETLRVLVSRRAVSPQQAASYAVQIAQGLAAAHAKGIVHRDVKPENLFVTSDDRLKILDFGLAQSAGGRDGGSTETDALLTSPGSVLGTAAYMSPEQARGLPVDQRTDIFALGVVLYELVSGRHPFRRESPTATLAAILEEAPADLSSVSRGVPPALSGVVRRCLEKGPEQRFASAHDLALSLEAAIAGPVARGSEEDVERSPYPGLSSFGERDAPVFFGRDAVVESLWAKLRERPLLALIAPSGAGKTSLVRAGVVAARPPGWSAIVCTPGTSPLRGLGRGLAAALAGDAAVLGALVDIDDPSVAFDVVRRWRSTHPQALLVVDQFEELFTLNRSETQRCFSGLLARVAAEADVHVLLAVRDDFLIRCSEHACLASLFKDLTPLPPLDREQLVRALVEPARRRGYRFEDDALVQEMVAAVEGVRSPLPLLAFAVSRLWDQRDHERKLLTRAEYERSGGLAGALAQHAERVIDRIGSERQPLVRDIFRHLVTAEGTRAVVDRAELLSAFPGDSRAADEVVRELIDARLLASYEPDGFEGQPSHSRVEIVHESLLATWPRLVRWRAQDEDGAVLRDQLRQAARLWHDRGRRRDLLWTGTARREFELWRERHPSQLTAVEEEFAGAMADEARRLRRRRRAAVIAGFLVLGGVTALVSVSLRRESAARVEAVDAARRSEASRVLALGQLRLADDPTEALALATASLELADSKEARLFALKALWESPPAIEIGGNRQDAVRVPAFSPDGKRLAAAGHAADAWVWHEEGGSPVRLAGHEFTPRGPQIPAWTSPGQLAVGLMVDLGSRVRLWSLPEGRLERVFDFGEPSLWGVGADSLYSYARRGTDRAASPGQRWHLRRWPLDGAPVLDLGNVPAGTLAMAAGPPSPAGELWVHARRDGLFARPLRAADARERRLVAGRFRGVGRPPQVGPSGLVVVDETGAVSPWRIGPGERPEVTRIEPPDTAIKGALVVPHPSGRWLVHGRSDDSRVQAWRRPLWPGARPIELRRNTRWYGSAWALHPFEDWVVASTASFSRLTFWPLGRRHPVVVDGYRMVGRPVLFSPDGRWLATYWPGTTGVPDVRLWPVGSDAASLRTLHVPERSGWLGPFAFDPRSRFLFTVPNGSVGGAAWVVPLDGTAPTRLAGIDPEAQSQAVAVSPSGRFAAAAYSFSRGRKLLHVWDLQAGSTRTLRLPVPSATGKGTGYEGGVWSIAFTDEETVYTAGAAGLLRWDLRTGNWRQLAAAPPNGSLFAEVRGDVAVTRASSGEESGCDNLPIMVRQLSSGAERPVPAFTRTCGDSFSLDPSGTILAVGRKDGNVGVARLDRGEAHLLTGHTGAFTLATVSPDRKWIASTSEDNTLRLWPMPDLDQPPLHTLPREALLVKLRSLTNLRAVRDDTASDGWRVDVGPFPGWKDVPTW